MKVSEKNKIRKAVAILKLLIIIGIILIVPITIYLRNPEFIDNFRSLESIDSLIMRYEKWSIPVYIICQILQVIITIIPGQAIQIAGGYIYGIFFGTVLSLIGIVIGSSISFGLARVLGRNSIELIFGDEKLGRYSDMLNTKKAHIIIFILYLVPGFPKDIVAYAAGVSDMKFSIFLELSMIGRIPGMMISIMIGFLISTKSFIWAIILALGITIIFVICIVKRKKIIDFMNRLYDKETIDHKESIKE